MSTSEDVQAAELTELLREADAVAYSLREFLNQPTLAETVDDLASRLAAETARADDAESALRTAVIVASQERARADAAEKRADASLDVVVATRQIIGAALAMENGGRGCPPAEHTHLSMVKAEGELLAEEALARYDSARKEA